MTPCLERGCPTLVKAGRCAVHARTRDAQRLQSEPGRQWYYTAAWRKLAAYVKREEPLCRTCFAADRLTPSTQVDHVIPHRGDPVKFWDRDNLAGTCASCHTQKTRRGE